MKLKIDNIQVRDLVDTGTPDDPQDPAVRIRIGPHEMMTRRSVDGGIAAVYSDMFEVEVDEYEYKDGKLEIEVEVINLGSELNLGSVEKNIHVGSGHATVHSVIPQFDNEAYFIIDLTHFGRKGNFRKGEVLMRGFLHDPEAIREALKFKTIELENLKTSYAEFITSSTKLEGEMEEALRKADAKIQKLTKKNVTITETLTTVTNQYNQMSSEFNMIQQELYTLREHGGSQNQESLRREQELTYRLEQLNGENNDLRHRLDLSEQDYRALQGELEGLYSSKYELELVKNEEVRLLQEENERLKKLANKPDHSGIMMEMSEKMMAMAKEIQELRSANKAAGSIHYNNTYITNNVTNNTIINNQYFEYIINSTNITNVYVTNIIQNGSIEELRNELLNQLRQVETLTFNNASLLSRIQDVSGNMLVCARTRPPSEEETNGGGKLCIDTSPDGSEMTCFDKTVNSWKSFPFDKVWGYDSTQKDVFTDLEPMVASVVEGANACIISYGHTLSGKTFTMNGFQTADHMGVAYRSLQKVFELLSSKQTKVDKKLRKESELADGTPGPVDEALLFKYSVEMSLVDIFNEQVVDLFGGNPANGPKWTAVSKPADAMVVYSKSIQFARNKSSVLHRVLQIQITTSGGGSQTPQKSILYLVDVMNSEQVGRDVSLTTFHQVLEILQANPTPTPQVLATIPYEKSKLTTLLKPCLGGNSKTMIILTVNPTDLHLKESLTNLAFISKLKSIKVLGGAAGGEGASAGGGANNSLELKNLRSEIKNLKDAKATAEKLLKETKDQAGDLIDQWKAQYYELVNNNGTDKDQRAQLASDLGLTQKQLNLVMTQLREQTDINERLLRIIKIYEDELAISAKQELPLAAQQYVAANSTNGHSHK